DHRHEGRRPLTGHARFFGEYGESGSMEDRQRRSICGEVKAVLTWPGPRRPPVVQHIQRTAYGLNGFAENLEQSDLIHGSRTLLVIGPRLTSRLIQLWQPLTSPDT